MLKTVILAKDSLSPESWTTHEVGNVADFLMQEFAEWPASARIYHNQVSEENDITPTSEKDIETLSKLEGVFYVVVYPAGLITLGIIALVAIAAIVAFGKKPKPPIPAVRNIQNQSPNNALSERKNAVRLNGRINDIFGTVRCTPDYIALPYSVFINHQEVQISYLCIGKGYYETPSEEVKDDTTRIIDIAGSSIEIYPPFTSPNSGDEPQLRIGAPINTPVSYTLRSSSVNGQVLRAPNDMNVKGASNIKFSAPNEIRLIESSTLDFTEKFFSGDSLVIQNARKYETYFNDVKSIYAFDNGSFKFEISSNILPEYYVADAECVLTGALFTQTDDDGFITNSYDLSSTYSIQSVNLIEEVIAGDERYFCNVVLTNPSLINPKWNEALGIATTCGIRLPSGATIYDLDNTYTVLSVSNRLILLSNPSSLNSEWNTINTEYISPTLSTSGEKWVGPFALRSSDLQQVFANFVASNGLYKDDGANQYRIDVLLELELTPTNSNNVAIGPAELFQATLEGSASYRGTRAVTLKALPTFTGFCKVRARRVTPSDLTFAGSVVDEIKWRDVYAVSQAEELHFGNVTTLQSLTYATESALAVKEGKINLLVTRQIPIRTTGSNFTTELYATNNADDILSFVCLDEFIGNRSKAEIDFDSIYNTIQEVRDYFGTNKAAEFCYTFDNNNLSFEETVEIICSAVFCTPYRRGNVLKLHFEKQTDSSVMLFNHRNKLPNTETRSVQFGIKNDLDGVSLDYVDPVDDAVITYYIPEDGDIVNPEEIETLGVRNKLQAYFHAKRAWNKLQYQNTSVEFTSTQEANLLIEGDRILIADSTRPDTQDGEILSQNGLELTLSQKVDLTKYTDYYIFLQHSDETIESIEITTVSSANKVVLANAPKLPLCTDDRLYAKTVYQIVGNQQPRQNAFILSEKLAKNNFTCEINAYNYDSRYYLNDSDFINNIVDEDGNII